MLVGACATPPCSAQATHTPQLIFFPPLQVGTHCSDGFHFSTSMAWIIGVYFIFSSQWHAFPIFNDDDDASYRSFDQSIFSLARRALLGGGA